VSGYSFAVQVANGVDTSFLETSGNVTVASITSGFDSATLQQCQELIQLPLILPGFPLGQLELERFLSIQHLVEL